jgi:hypothetical protein
MTCINIVKTETNLWSYNDVNKFTGSASCKMFNKEKYQEKKITETYQVN